MPPRSLVPFTFCRLVVRQSTKPEEGFGWQTRGRWKNRLGPEQRCPVASAAAADRGLDLPFAYLGVLASDPTDVFGKEKERAHEGKGSKAKLNAGASFVSSLKGCFRTPLGRYFFTSSFLLVSYSGSLATFSGGHQGPENGP